MEHWKIIPDFPNYAVSDHGRVKSLARVVRRGDNNMLLPERILTPGAGKKCGHRFVNLRRNKKPTSTYVHRLVAKMFIGEPPEGKPQVAHWDGDTANNHVSNLRWASAAENSQDSIRLGRNGRPSGTKSGRGKFSDEDIIAIYGAYQSGESIRSIGRRHDSPHNTVSNLLRQKSYGDDCKRLGLSPAR